MELMLGELRVGLKVKFKGDATNCRHARLYGSVQGFTEGRYLSIGQQGCLEGDGRYEFVQIFGKLKGSLECTGKLNLRKSGKVIGDVLFDDIEMDRGAWIEGRLLRAPKRPPNEQNRSLWIDPSVLAASIGNASSSSSATFEKHLELNKVEKEAILTSNQLLCDRINQDQTNLASSSDAVHNPKPYSDIAAENAELSAKPFGGPDTLGNTEPKQSTEDKDTRTESGYLRKKAARLLEAPKGTIMRSWSNLSKASDSNLSKVSDSKRSTGLGSPTSIDMEDALLTPPRIDRVQSLGTYQRKNITNRQVNSSSSSPASKVSPIIDNSVLGNARLLSPKYQFETPTPPHNPSYISPEPTNILGLTPKSDLINTPNEGGIQEEQENEEWSNEGGKITDDLSEHQTQITQSNNLPCKKKTGTIADFYSRDDSDSDSEMLTLKKSSSKSASSHNSRSMFSFKNVFSAKNLLVNENAENNINDSPISLQTPSHDTNFDDGNTETLRMNHLKHIMQAKRVGGVLGKGNRPVQFDS